MFCQVKDTEWADSMVYGRDSPRPTITAGSRLRLQLWMIPTRLEAAIPGDEGVRLVRVDEPTYEISAWVRRVAIREYGTNTRHVGGSALLDSLPPIVLVLERMEAKAVKELRGKFVAVTGTRTLMGAFYKVFWNAPFPRGMMPRSRRCETGRETTRCLKSPVLVRRGGRPQNQGS